MPPAMLLVSLPAGGHLRPGHLHKHPQQTPADGLNDKGRIVEVSALVAVS